jgi:polygalacturonase
MARVSADLTLILGGTMHSRLCLLIPFVSLYLAATTLFAQDTRNVSEPVIPPTCAVVHAPLHSTAANGPIVGDTVAEQDLESDNETKAINQAYQNAPSHCVGQAVELALGSDPSLNSFLINPIDLPIGVSLIIDGGVTVYGSRDPREYQDPDPNVTATCGTIGGYKVDEGCLPLIALTSDSGIYGYGIIDGQGNRTLINGQNAPGNITWWNLTTYKNRSSPGTYPIINQCDGDGQKPCLQSSPEVIQAGIKSNGPNPTCVPGSQQEDCNLTLYKITIRNPPYHTTKLGGTNVTIWGVKVQSPWNIPNTDGFDIHASNVTVYDTTVANGDQEVVFGSTDGPSTNITVDGFKGYGKGGITILANGFGTSNMMVRNANITGDLPSVVGTNVNGLPYAAMKKLYGLASYGQALPNASNDLKAIQITNAVSNTSHMSNITFQSVCIQDIVKPIDVELTPGGPTLQSFLLKDVHVLPPSVQFPGFSNTNKGVPNGDLGLYQLTFLTKTPTSTPDQITLDNVVFDNGSTGLSSIGSIDAEGQVFSTLTNVFPSVFNRLSHPAYETKPKPTPDPGGSGVLLTLSDNPEYAATTPTNNQSFAHACQPDALPFITGDLFVSTADTTNLQTASVTAGDSVTLNAVVQPAMSQTTLFIPGSYGASPGLLSVGAPKLINPVLFYEGSRLVGVGRLSANGTLATFIVNNIRPGTHTYIAQYPADFYYRTLNFGSVTVTAEKPPASQISFVIAGPTFAVAGQRAIGFIVSALRNGRPDRFFDATVNVSLSGPNGLVEEQDVLLQGQPRIVNFANPYSVASTYALTVTYGTSATTHAIKVLP